MTQASKPMNLLVIISDEHRKDAMGCVGHPLVQTPNLDALAARGTTFTNAYTPSPMCVPTRAALATGEPVHQCRNWDSATPYKGQRRSWMRQLRDQGVHVASLGKLHFRSSEDDNGFSEEILPMHVVGGVGWADALLRADPRPYDSAAELAADVGEGASSYTDYDLAITDAAERWLSDPARQGNTPWAGFVSLVSPHYPLTCPAEFMGLYEPADMDLPIARDAKPTHPELQNIARFFDYDRHFDEAKVREAKAAYYGLISFMDHCVGRVLKALENSGQAENTCVLYVSDHGDMMGDQGFWTKQVMYEASAGIPMILAGAGVPAGKTVSTATSLLDIAATAVEVTGCIHDAASAALPGTSLIGLSAEPNDPERTVLSEYHDGGSKTGAFMVRWANWKYVYYAGQDPQLFDLAADPHELDDLGVSGDPVAAAARAEGEARLRAFCDPEAVNAQAFADQAETIARLGGPEAVRNAFVFNHTPTPTEQAAMALDKDAAVGEL